jgi:hypothetical protein
MFSVELFLVSTLKALVEIAAMALVAQGVVGLISGDARQQNLIYRLFRVVTAPVIRLVRKLAPGFVADAHLGWLGFLLLSGLWVALVFAKGYVCHTRHLACVAG